MRWRVRLFDGPALESPSGDQVNRFRSHQVGALLSYLALRLGKSCPREELECALWPDEIQPAVLANRLRVTLASLRRHLEPPGVPFGSVLDVSVPGRVKLREESVWCDAAAFETALDSGDSDAAWAIIKGELLPGFYEDWATLERERFVALAENLSPSRVNLARRDESDPPTFARTESSHDTYPLPLYLTRYFGRVKERDAISKLLAERRLITISGPGGMGKTRLAVESARLFSGTAIFVSLAEINSGGQVVSVVVQSLRLSLHADADLTDEVVSCLRRITKPLLILDNAELVVDEVAALCLKLLEQVSGLIIVVTTRQRLGIPGEASLLLPPLPTPSADASYEELATMPAVELFLDRARNARPDFLLLARHTPAILQICKLLEGVPLALELAAARVIAQTPSQIMDSLAVNLTELKSRQRGLSARHQSLRASIQGSYDVLTPDLRRFFSHLWVFASGWTSEAAQAVTGEPNSAWFLEDLVQRSIVYVIEDESEHSLRYAFLESIRQFAGEQLSSTDQGALAKAHRDYFLSLASKVSEHDVNTLEGLDSEMDNLVKAMQVGSDSNSASFSLGLCGVLTFAHIRGKHRLFLPWAEYALEIATQTDDIPQRIKVRYAAYFIFSYLGRAETVMEIGEAIRVDALATGDASSRILGSLILGWAEGQFQRAGDAFKRTTDALKAAELLHDPLLTAQCLRITGWMAYFIAEQKNLSDSEKSGYLILSEEHLRRCLSLLTESSSHRPFVELTLTYILTITQRIEEAYGLVKSVEVSSLRYGMQAMAIFAFRQESIIALIHGQAEYSAFIYGVFRGMRERTGYNAYSGLAENEDHVSKLILTLGKKRFDLLELKGRKADLQDIVKLNLYDSNSGGFDHLIDR